MLVIGYFRLSCQIILRPFGDSSKGIHLFGSALGLSAQAATQDLAPIIFLSMCACRTRSVSTKKSIFSCSPRFSTSPTARTMPAFVGAAALFRGPDVFEESPSDPGNIGLFPDGSRSRKTLHFLPFRGIYATGSNPVSR